MSSEECIVIDDYQTIHSTFHIHVLAAGGMEDPPVLLLHGRNYDASIWQELGTLELLASLGCRAVAIDLPGFGTTDDVRISPNTYLKEILPALEISRPIVVAPCLAGRFALPWALRHPRDFNGLVAVAPVAAEEFAPRLANSEVPTMVIWGERDARYPVAVGQHLADSIPGTRLEVLPGARHACYVDEPERFHQLLEEFVTSIYGRPGDADAGDEAEAVAEAVAEADPEAEAVADPEAEAVAEAVADPEAEAVAEADPEAGPDPEAVAEADPEAEAEASDEEKGGCGTGCGCAG